MSDYQQRMERLLKAMYDLANGEPSEWVDGHKAAEAADVREQSIEYTSMCKYLEGAGFIVSRDPERRDQTALAPAGISAVKNGWPQTRIYTQPPRQPPSP